MFTGVGGIAWRFKSSVGFASNRTLTAAEISSSSRLFPRKVPAVKSHQKDPFHMSWSCQRKCFCFGVDWF